ncbi:MAG: CapA family protein [Lachnospiraceae bacterium]|nr:CapA family protein [Lachnospiraceae bacterium]
MKKNNRLNRIQNTGLKAVIIVVMTILLAGLLGCDGENLLPVEPSPQGATPVVKDTGRDIDMGTPAYTLAPTATPVPTNTSTPTPTPTEVPRMTVCMVGDILLHDTLEADCKQTDGSYDYKPLFALTKDIISSYDVALVNQELIIGGEDLGVSGYPSFNTAFSLADALEDAGFDVALHATNHALDKGKKGLLNCIHNWKENHDNMGVVGIYESEAESEEIYITEKNGIRVAVLNFTYGTNGISAPEDMPWCVSMLTEDNVIRALDKAEELADFTIVCPHWGTEYSLELSSQQKKFMMLFKEHGADLVIGTHPHVIQSITVVNDEGETECLSDGYSLKPDDMLVYYSLGNFVSWTGESGKKGIANRMLGGIADISLCRNDEGKVFVEDFGVIPVVSHVEKGNNACAVYPFADYTGTLAEKSAIIAQDKDYTLQYLYDLCNRIWGDLWKKQGTPDLNTAQAFELDTKLVSSGEGATKKMQDGSYKTATAFTKADTLTITSEMDMYGLYLCWNDYPQSWTLECDGEITEHGSNGFLHEYVNIPKGTKKCVMHFTSDEAICKLTAYTGGKLPYDVQVWEPACEKADILAFSTHADDEILFLGGVLAKYAGEQNKKVQVAYMCEFFSSSRIREHEKLDGIWHAGVRNYPVNGTFPDKYSETIEEAKRIYNYDSIVDYLTAQIRRFKPLVVVTQDDNGEYGHGGHMVLVDAVKRSVENSMNADFCETSAAEYGVWDVPKTYLHIWKENKVKLDLRQPVDAFGGKTSIEILDEAYKLHVSQQWCWFYVSDAIDKPKYKYSCADFGLYRTTVGPDTGNDMMENVVAYGE